MDTISDKSRSDITTAARLSELAARYAECAKSDVYIINNDTGARRLAEYLIVRLAEDFIRKS